MKVRKSAVILFVLSSLTLIGCASSEGNSSSDETSTIEVRANPEGYDEADLLISWDISNKASEPVTAQLYKDKENEGFYVLYISGSGAMKKWTSFLGTPWYKLYRSKIISVEIADGVTSIGYGAFYRCDHLLKAYIGSSVTEIEEKAFSYCDQLRSLSLGSSITKIGNQAFFCCGSLSSIVLPDSVESIGDNAFFYCDRLLSLTLPQSLKTIGDMAFAGCYKLVEIINRSSLSLKVGSEDYGYLCAHALTIKKEGNSDIVSDDGYLFYTYDSKDYLLEFDGAEDALSLPENYDGKNYQIYDYAFYDYESLSSITIPNGVISIGKSAFSYCTSLTAINVPDSVVKLGEGAFSNCLKLASVTLPDGLSDLATDIFRDCALKEINIPSKVSNIGTNAFSFCDALTSLTIPNGVKALGDHSFYLCTGLTSIDIPGSVTSIGGWSFWGCQKLLDINYSGSITQWKKISFGPGWISEAPATGVHCLDGDTTLY